MSKITLGKKEFELSPIPLKGLVALEGRLHLIGKDFSQDSADALVDGIYYGLKRNHPEIDRELVELNIDATNLNQVLTAFVQVNNFAKAAENTGKPKARK